MFFLSYNLGALLDRPILGNERWCEGGIVEIYIIDDKQQNLDAAYTAVVSAGHTRLEAEVLCENGGTIPELSVGLAPKEELRFQSDCAWREIVWAIHLLKQNGGGIITDLMFSTTGKYLDQGLPPTGLMVATLAIASGVPVCICTNASDEDGHHHGPRLSWIYDGFVAQFRNYQQFLEGEKDPSCFTQFNLPFGWVEDKDWGKAVKYLEEVRK